MARALLSDKTSAFAVRAITRSPESDSAKTLAALGAETVRADGRDTASLVKAFTGSWGAFANTNSDDPVCVHTRVGHVCVRRCADGVGVGDWRSRCAERDGHRKERRGRRGRGRRQGLRL